MENKLKNDSFKIYRIYNIVLIKSNKSTDSKLKKQGKEIVVISFLEETKRRNKTDAHYHFYMQFITYRDAFQTSKLVL